MRFSWNIIWFEKIGTLRLMYFGNVINFVFRKSGVVWQRDSVGCDIWDKLCDVRLFWILQHSPVTSLKKTKNIAPKSLVCFSGCKSRAKWIAMVYAFFFYKESAFYLSFFLLPKFSHASALKRSNLWNEDWPICIWIGSPLHPNLFTSIAQPAFKTENVDTLYSENTGICIGQLVFVFLLIRSMLWKLCNLSSIKFAQFCRQNVG